MNCIFILMSRSIIQFKKFHIYRSIASVKVYGGFNQTRRYEIMPPVYEFSVTFLVEVLQFIIYSAIVYRVVGIYILIPGMKIFCFDLKVKCIWINLDFAIRLIKEKRYIGYIKSSFYPAYMCIV